MGATPLDDASLPGGESPANAVVKTLLLTDLVESTALLAKLGDAKTFEVSSRHDRVARDLLVRFRGHEIDKTDGFLFLFDQPADAVAYALTYHRALAELSVELKVQLRARTGIHVGEVLLRSNPPEDVARGAKPLEVEGLAKPTAARTMSLAKANQTLLTKSAFDLARREPLADLAHEARLRWLAHGPYLFKGVQEPIEIFEVGAEGFAPLAVPPDTDKAKRAVQVADEHVLGWRPAPGQEVLRRPHWVLRTKLGEGGFGEVWLAVHRKSEEKRIFKFCFDADRLRSLQREVTLFRLLKETLGNRQDISRILDWEFDEAPYFLEAEYSEGGNLADWARDQGGIETVPLRTRLELMAQVADALAAAHSVGVLHKDVKPANVLVQDQDGEPRIRLTDFGIGAVLDQAALLARGITVAGITQLRPDSDSWSAGTQMYMAPELQEGKPATVQADVYALGVMLYQTIVGDLTRALGVGWERDVDDELLREDIAASTDRSFQRRLSSAQALADRLRQLDARRQRVEEERAAREKAAADRAALEQAHRRRKRWAWASSLAAVVAIVVSFLAYQAVAARKEADSRRNQAEDLIGFMIGDLRPKLEQVGRLDILDDVGNKALEYFAAVPEAMLSDNETFRRAEGLQQIGQIRIDRGDLPAAIDVLGQALALVSARIPHAPDNAEWIFDLSQIHYWLGFAHWRQRNFELSLPHLAAYRDLSERLVDIDPNREDWLAELGYSHHNMGALLREKGQLGEALDEFRRGLEIKEELLRRKPDDLERVRELATTHNHIGLTLERMGDVRGALAEYEIDLDLKKQLAQAEPSSVGHQYRLAVSLNYLSAALEGTGSDRDALGRLMEALKITERLVAHDASNMRWKRELGGIHCRAARMMLRDDQVASAIEHADKALDLLESVSEKDSSNAQWRLDFARALVVRSELHAHLGAFDEAFTLSQSGAAAVRELLAEMPDFEGAKGAALEATLLLGAIGIVVGKDDEAAAALEDFARIAGTVQQQDWRVPPMWFDCAHMLSFEESTRIEMAQRLLQKGLNSGELVDACRPNQARE